MATRLAIGASLVVLALALRGWAQATLRDHGITPEKLGATVTPTSYATTGPYRALRHPLYAGHLLLIAGVGLLSLGWGGVTLALAALPHFAHRAAEEDAHRKLAEEAAAIADARQSKCTHLWSERCSRGRFCTKCLKAEPARSRFELLADMALYETRMANALMENHAP